MGRRKKVDIELVLKPEEEVAGREAILTAYCDRYQLTEDEKKRMDVIYQDNKKEYKNAFRDTLRVQMFAEDKDKGTTRLEAITKACLDRAELTGDTKMLLDLAKLAGEIQNKQEFNMNINFETLAGESVKKVW